MVLPAQLLQQPPHQLPIGEHAVLGPAAVAAKCPVGLHAALGHLLGKPVHRRGHRAELNALLRGNVLLQHANLLRVVGIQCVEQHTLRIMVAAQRGRGTVVVQHRITAAAQMVQPMLIIGGAHTVDFIKQAFHPIAAQHNLILGEQPQCLAGRGFLRHRDNHQHGGLRVKVHRADFLQKASHGRLCEQRIQHKHPRAQPAVQQLQNLLPSGGHRRRAYLCAVRFGKQLHCVPVQFGVERKQRRHSGGLGQGGFFVQGAFVQQHCHISPPPIHTGQPELRTHAQGPRYFHIENVSASLRGPPLCHTAYRLPQGLPPAVR